MKTNLIMALDECIIRINEGETVDSCLERYPHLREEIEPLLCTALSIAATPKEVPSAEFREASRARLMARLRRETAQGQAVRPGRGMRLFEEVAALRQGLRHAITSTRKIAIPATIALLLITIATFGALNFLSPTPALASQCTLSILSGSATVLEPGADKWQPGADGMTLVAGSRVKTGADSHALLTFFEGSTIKLEANTDIEIQQVVSDDEKDNAIVLRQWAGKTWSRVVKMTDPNSHYEIDTPSAHAIVRGTLFTTEVNETGATRVATTEGLVSVVAQSEEVYIPANQQTRVETGAAPSPPEMAIPDSTGLIITSDMPAVASVRDPTGSSTGYLPNGLSFNQIAGSQSTSLPDGTQVITIPHPVSGEYVIALRFAGEGESSFNVRGESNGERTFEYTSEFQTAVESGWLVYLDLQVEGSLIVRSEVSGIEALGEEMPEKIVGPELAKRPAAPTGPPAQNREEPPAASIDQSRGNSQDKGNNGAQPDSPDRGNNQLPGNQGADYNQALDNVQTQMNDKARDNAQDKDKAPDNSNNQPETSNQGQGNIQPQSGGEPQGNAQDKDKDIPGGSAQDKDKDIPGGNAQDKDKDIPGGSAQDKDKDIPGGSAQGQGGGRKEK